MEREEGRRDDPRGLPREATTLGISTDSREGILTFRGKVPSVLLSGGKEPSEDALLSWDHGGGSSLHASVRIEAPDRAGLERFIRYYARPSFVLEPLPLVDGRFDRVLYLLPTPRSRGSC